MPGVNKLDRIRQQIYLGVPVGDAIRLAIGGSIPKWASDRDIHRTEASMTIHSKRLPPSPRVVSALAEHLEVSEDDVRDLLDLGTRQVSESGRSVAIAS